MLCFSQSVQGIEEETVLVSFNKLGNQYLSIEDGLRCRRDSMIVTWDFYPSI